MKIEQLAALDRVFIDANILIYALLPDPANGARCSELLRRIANRELSAFTSSHVLNNVCHRVMTVEACETFGWQYTGIARQMTRHPDEVRKLYRYREAVQGIIDIGIDVIPVGVSEIVQATQVTAALGLLSGDALIVSTMQSYNISRLASGDADFDRVPGIVRAGL